MINKYIKFLSKNNYSENTIKTYYSVLKKYEKYINDIRNIKKILRTYFNSPNTVQLHYNVILSYLNWIKDKRVNELKKIKLPVTPYKYLNVFSKEYLEKK